MKKALTNWPYGAVFFFPQMRETTEFQFVADMEVKKSSSFFELQRRRHLQMGQLSQETQRISVSEQQ
jgi:hypothetical protein